MKKKAGGPHDSSSGQPGVYLHIHTAPRRLCQGVTTEIRMLLMLDDITVVELSTSTNAAVVAARTKVPRGEQSEIGHSLKETRERKWVKY